MQTLVAAAGYVSVPPRPDRAGTDLVILGSEEIEEDFPLIKIQVKSWSVPRGDANYWRYRELNEKQFNILAGVRQTPIYLVVVLVPPDITYYTTADSESLVLRRAAYWVSLAGMAKLPTPDVNRKVSVAVPRANLLTVDSVVRLCEASVKGYPKAAVIGSTR